MNNNSSSSLEFLLVVVLPILGAGVLIGGLLWMMRRGRRK